MTQLDQFARDVLQKVVESIEIPQSHYKAATDRYRSLGDWLDRQDSTIAADRPEVHPQGSFRLGTVIRPLNSNCGYDLDLVCELRNVEKDEDSQANLKARVGAEIHAYAKAHGMETPKEGRRCWKLAYRGQPSFHIDSLPAIPEDAATKSAIAEAIRRQNEAEPGVAETAIAITDKTSQRYEVITDDWNMSNPAGFATWFESRMRSVALARMEALVQDRAYAKVEDVPAYEWKTPLQVAVQLLKRHRDTMFAEEPDIAPISVIIATLAGRAYRDEVDLLDALDGISERMSGFVRSQQPRIPNPSNPGEDFADKWDATREAAFFRWVDQVRADIRTIRSGMQPDRLRRFLKSAFGVTASDEWVAAACASTAATVPAEPRRVNITNAPGQWRDG